MITYEVHVEVRPDLADAFAAYMRTKHLPEIWATGCFHSIAFEQSSPTLFRSRYQAATREALDQYLDQHTEHFRADFMAHFPQGAVASRCQWNQLHLFS